MKKRIAPISLALIFSLVILTVQCRFEPPAAGTGKHSNRSIETGFDEEKILTNVSLASSFADNRVLIVLKKSVSMDFRTYTPEDFPEIPGIVRVVDASRRTMAIVQEQLNAQKTGDWSKLRRRMELGMLGDVNRFRRILYLELAVQSKENVLQVIKLLEQREEIWYCGPDYVIEFGTIPNPSPIPHANQIDTFNSISLLEAWDYISTNNIPVDTTVKVGIMDTGVYKYHEALDGQIDEYLSRDFSTGDPDGLGGDPFDDAHRDRVFFGGHGTPIAGILAANGTDVTGIYWYGTVVSLKLQGHNYMSSCEFLSYAINAIDYANDEDVLIPILNFSAVVSGFDIALYTAINQYDGLFVCIANNNGYNNDELPIFPANWTADFDFRKFSYVFPNSQYMPYLPRLSNLISVGALDEFNNGRRDSSNYGATSVDLFAPGTDIWTTYNFSGYGPFDHTSAAAPIVAGVAALVKSIHPNLLGPQLKDILLASVEEVPNLKVNNYCRTGGKINAYNAVTQTPPIGSMEIIFAGIGLGNVGKFFLHPNGTWEIIEKGIYTSPISSFAHNPENVHLSPVPSEITTYMIQNNIDDISDYFYLWVPVTGTPDAIYYKHEFYFTITSTGAYYCNYTGNTIEEEVFLPSEKRMIKVAYTSGQTVSQIPNIGSIDISIGSSSSTYGSTTPGRIGKFYLLPNNTWEIAEKSIYAYPLTFNPITNPSFTQWGPVPAGIISYMDNEGIASITGHFNWLVPALTSPGTYDYYSHAFSFTIDSTGVQLQHIGSDSIESLLSSDKRRIYIEYTSGSIY